MSDTSEDPPRGPDEGEGDDGDADHLTSRREFVLGLGGSSLTLLAGWAGLGLLREGGHGGHSHGGSGMSKAEFRRRHQAFLEEHRRDDGVVEVPPADGHHGADVYVAARRWAYEPAEIVLQAGATYRFRMMAMDVAHGASIEMADGSRMNRLPPGALIQDTVTFQERGEHLLYCSYYCGHGHDDMSGVIRVV